MAVAVVEVTDRAGRKDFATLPFRLYGGCRAWVPPIISSEMEFFDPRRNPSFRTCRAALWVALSEGRPVGRIAGIFHPSERDESGRAMARFGWPDFVDDPAVSGALLDTVERWAAAQGAAGLRGPLGFTDLDPQGLLVEGFDEPGTIATLYHHRYCAAHLERRGYVPETDWVEYDIPVPPAVPAELARMADVVRRRTGARVVRPRTRAEMMAFAPRVFDIVNRAFAGMFGTVPLSAAQADHYASRFRFLDPAYSGVVLDGKGELVGFGISSPSPAEGFRKCRGRLFPLGFVHVLRSLRRAETVDLYLIGLLPEFRGKGLMALLLEELCGHFIRQGHRRVESHPELETNRDIRTFWRHFPARQHKRRRCLARHFAPAADPGERRAR